MRTSGLFLTAAAAVASAHFTEKDGVYTCETPNASYCLGGDIILRCDAYGKGTPGRCSANLSGYPPAGGVASCYEKPGTEGSAVCVKNCVVYGDQTYTLPSELCHPTYTTSSVETLSTIYTHPTHEPSQYPNSTKPAEPTHPGKPGEPGHPGKPGKPNYPNPTEPGKPYEPKPTNPEDCITKTQTIVYPNPTQSGEKVTRTITYTIPTAISHNSTIVHPPHKPGPTGTPGGHQPNATCPDCGDGQKGGSKGGKGGDAGDKDTVDSPDEATHLPARPTAVPDTIPTAGAAMNTVTGVLAIVGVVAAYLI